jgi:putative NIF3 family GTP cyclohydrolase 1 type 2
MTRNYPSFSEFKSLTALNDYFMRKFSMEAVITSNIREHPMLCVDENNTSLHKADHYNSLAREYMIMSLSKPDSYS